MGMVVTGRRDGRAPGHPSDRGETMEHGYVDGFKMRPTVLILNVREFVEGSLDEQEAMTWRVRQGERVGSANVCWRSTLQAVADAWLWWAHTRWAALGRGELPLVLILTMGDGLPLTLQQQALLSACEASGYTVIEGFGPPQAGDVETPFARLWHETRLGDWSGWNDITGMLRYYPVIPSSTRQTR